MYILNWKTCDNIVSDFEELHPQLSWDNLYCFLYLSSLLQYQHLLIIVSTWHNTYQYSVTNHKPLRAALESLTCTHYQPLLSFLEILMPNCIFSTHCSLLPAKGHGAKLHSLGERKKENRSKDESYNRQRPLPRIIQSIATTIDKKETVSGVEGESDVTHKVFSSWLLIAATAEDL